MTSKKIARKPHKLSALAKKVLHVATEVNFRILNTSTGVKILTSHVP
ncbi:hypothetical protein T08_16494 [Trichinella sp. T8]|nr:hypothetical protein T08_16494 [Trichinella sp. T8]